MRRVHIVPVLCTRARDCLQGAEEIVERPPTAIRFRSLLSQVLNFMVGFCVHAYLVYCVWSYKKKLLDQSKGIFEGEPVMRVQKFEAQGLQMTHTTAPGQVSMP